MKNSFRIFVCVLMALFWGLLCLGVCLIVVEIITRSAAAAPLPFHAAPIRANAARIIREPAPERASVESHVRPTPQGVPPASPFGVPSASIYNPAIAGSRVMSGPGFCSGYSVKQYAVDMSATLPVVAGSI